MKSTGIIRNIDSLGRFVIPKELREIYDLKQGSSMEIFLNDGEITMRDSTVKCAICGSDTELKQIKNKQICQSCLSALMYIDN